MHIHISALDGIKTGLYVIITLYLLRLLQVKTSGTAFGQALAFIH